MAKVQKAFILFKYLNQMFGQDSNLDELNKLLSEGWSVAKTEPLGPVAEKQVLASLVVLEREDSPPGTG